MINRCLRTKRGCYVYNLHIYNLHVLIPSTETVVFDLLSVLLRIYYQRSLQCGKSNVEFISE